jgi:hypothetical protein
MRLLAFAAADADDHDLTRRSRSLPRARDAKVAGTIAALLLVTRRPYLLQRAAIGSPSGGAPANQRLVRELWTLDRVA